MRIIDKGLRMSLVDDEKEVVSNVSRISYNDGLYYCKEKYKVYVSGLDQIDVNLSFTINELKKNLNGPIYNDYFKNTDYIKDISDYSNYKKRLANRIRRDYKRKERNEFNEKGLRHWRYRK